MAPPKMESPTPGNSIKLSKVRVVSPVPFAGPTSLTLSDKDGTLEMDATSGMVVATPTRSGPFSKRIIIPASNVVFCEPK